MRLKDACLDRRPISMTSSARGGGGGGGSERPEGGAGGGSKSVSGERVVISTRIEGDMSTSVCITADRVSEGIDSTQSKMMRDEGWDDKRPVTNFLLLEIEEPFVSNAASMLALVPSA